MTIAGTSGVRAAIGEALQAWREANKLSREELAVALGCSCVTIRNYERGKREPTASVLLQLERAHPGLWKELQKRIKS